MGCHLLAGHQGPAGLRQGPRSASGIGTATSSTRTTARRWKSAGFVITGTSPDGQLVELIELRDHPWFLACQFHPEFQSKPNKPHPLFKGFVTACLAHDA